MNKYKSFIFKKYFFNENDKELALYYNYDDDIEFVERYIFDFDFTDYDKESLDRALNLLFFMAGVSYYKAFLASNIRIDFGLIDQSLSKFLSHTYQKGLGEFFYVNKIDPNTSIHFPVNSEEFSTIKAKTHNSKLVGIGGGKDSLVSIEVLKEQKNVYSFSVNHRKLLNPLVEVIGLPHFPVERILDKKLTDINAHGAYNGHVPISAIIACVGVVTAVLQGSSDIVVSNESSANEPTLIFDGVSINHQYSKSLEFEKDFQQLIKGYYGDTVRYYSLLRPLSELAIAELFAYSGFEKYKEVFSSCNRAFTSHSNHLYWCGECPKCAFIFLALTPFIKREKLEALWDKNLLLDPQLQETYKALLGITGDKPLDCVGEIKESRKAMRLAQSKYPELSNYKFDIPIEYDFRSFSQHCVPQEELKLLQEFISETLH